MPQPGDVVDGKYTVLRTIGEGGMGVVFEATHQKLGQRVAIKMLQPSVTRSADLVSRFEREARAAGRLRGRHVARVTDVEVSPGKLPYMVMELLDGHDLATELEERGPLPLEDVVDYLLQACKGLAEAHAAGIVHRDLKPSNLFLCDEGDQRVVKLLDFGISKMIDEASQLTSTQLTLGTLLYMSPEQVRSAKHVDGRTDIWALGVILFELLAGVPPFTGSAPFVAAAIVTDATPSLKALRADVPEAIDATVRKALSKLPADRFADVAAFAATIAPFGRPQQASGGRISYKSFPELPASSSEPRSPVALETAETIAGAAPLLGAVPPVVASGGTAPGWTSSTTSRFRRRAPWMALGGMAVVALVTGAGFLAVRGARGAAGASAAPAVSPVHAEPSSSATIPTAVSVAVSSDATPVVTPPLVATSNPTPTATPTAGRTKAVARASAQPAAPPPAVVSPPPPPPRKKEEKAPLIAPF